MVSRYTRFRVLLPDKITRRRAQAKCSQKTPLGLFQFEIAGYCFAVAEQTDFAEKVEVLLDGDL